MDGYVVIGTQLDTKSFEAQIDYIEGQLQEIEHKLKQADMGFEVGDTQKLEAQYEKLVNQLEILRKKQADINKADLTNIQKSIDKVGDSTSNVIKKVGKWALAVFGIRSAYMFVRNAMSTLSQYNEQIKADVEYIGFAMASMLQPVIEGLINLAYKLLTYVNYIAQAWFGVDLFANASADAMSKSAKSAEKMKKSLAGFDEMNVISDTSSSGGASANVPSLDLSAPEDIPIPSWLQWIADNKDIVIAGLLGIAGGLTAIHLGLSLIQGLGIGLILAGVALAIQDIIDFINDTSWENFVAILGDVAIVIGGIMLVMGNWWGLLVAIIGLIVKLIVENWDTIKETLGKVWDWIKEHIINPIKDGFSKLWEKIKEIFSPVIDFFSNLFGTAFENIKIAIDNLKQIFSFLWEKIKEIFEPVIDFFKEKFEKAFKKIKETFEPIVNFFKEIWDKVKNKLKDFGEKVGEVVGGAFKTVINGVLKAIENILNFPIKSINKLIDVINNVPGINLTKLSTFNLPRLAVGGIVNMPSRGVPIGGAIAGEAGAEGVIPLTNSQAMETLGQAIGKYVTINANITNTMNGRVISRELQKVNSSSDFAFNR